MGNSQSAAAAPVDKEKAREEAKKVSFFQSIYFIKPGFLEVIQ